MPASCQPDKIFPCYCFLDISFSSLTSCFSILCFQHRVSFPEVKGWQNVRYRRWSSSGKTHRRQCDTHAKNFVALLSMLSASFDQLQLTLKAWPDSVGTRELRCLLLRRKAMRQSSFLFSIVCWNALLASSAENRMKPVPGAFPRRIQSFGR